MPDLDCAGAPFVGLVVKGKPPAVGQRILCFMLVYSRH